MKHFYKGFLLEKNGTKDYPWNIYRPDGLCKTGPYAGQMKWRFETFERTMKDCKALIDSGAIELCDLMCR